jgi:hypothetical protein
MIVIVVIIVVMIVVVLGMGVLVVIMLMRHDQGRSRLLGNDDDRRFGRLAGCDGRRRSLVMVVVMVIVLVMIMIVVIIVMGMLILMMIVIKVMVIMIMALGMRLLAVMRLVEARSPLPRRRELRCRLRRRFERFSLSSSASRCARSSASIRA